MKLNAAQQKLVDLYLEALNEDTIPWRQRWANDLHVNGKTNRQYKGMNQLLLSYVAYKEHYDDNRWYSYKNIKDNNWKLVGAKGKGIPVEFIKVYDKVNKSYIDFDKYNEIILKEPELKNNFKIFRRITCVFNAKYIEGVPQKKNVKNNIETSNYISKLIKNLGVSYQETGNRAYYSPLEDKVVLPNKEKFIDKYSYYATQLHELCHSTGHFSRLNRKILNNDKKDYAREELVAEISSSFLMLKLNIDPSAEHIDNHKSYIQSWISILKEKPAELFNAINESKKVCDYIEDIQKESTRRKDYER